MLALFVALGLALPSFAALPARLPAGRQGAKLVATPRSTASSVSVLKRCAGMLGARLPEPGRWAGLDDEAGRSVLGLLRERLPSEFWAEVLLREELSERLQRKFLDAYADAAAEAGRLADQAFEALETEAAAGRVSFGDADDLLGRLRGLAVFGGRAAARHDELAAKVRDWRQALVDEGLDAALIGLYSRERERLDAVRAAGSRSTPLVSRRVRDPAEVQLERELLDKDDFRELPVEFHLNLPRSAAIGGWAFLGYSALAAIELLPTAIVPGLGSTEGLAAWTGIALLGVARMLGPRTASARIAEPVPAPALLARRVPSLASVWLAAQKSLVSHAVLAARVGRGSWKAFRRWLASGMKTALLWVPLALVGLVAGAAAAMPMKALTPGIGAASEYETLESMAAVPFSYHLNGYVASAVVQEIVVIGVVYRGARWALESLGVPRPGLFAAAAALAVAGAWTFMTAEFITWTALLGIVGLEAAMLGIYRLSGSLLVAGLLRGFIALISIQAARMSLYFALPAAGALVALPAWSGLAVAGVLLGGLALVWAKTGGGLRRELALLSDFKAWWSRPAHSGAPKSPWPLVALGTLWGSVTLSVGDLTGWLVTQFAPAVETAPDMLAKMVHMPLDVIVYAMTLVAGLEEWVFRAGMIAIGVGALMWLGQGGLRRLLERLRAGALAAPFEWLAGNKRRALVVAALVAAFVFSVTHLIDLGPILAKISPTMAQNAQGMLVGYGFSWSALFGRFTMALLLTFLYVRSGTLLLPIVAHAASNLLALAGLRWGLPAILLGVALIVAARLSRRLYSFAAK